MKASALEKWLVGRSDKYVALYGLSHWNIRFEIADADSELAGECITDPEYEKATIVLFAENIRDEAELHDTICHELEHILDSVYEIYQDSVNEVLPPKVKRATDALFINCVELARNNIGRFRANFFSEPPQP